MKNLLLKLKPHRDGLAVLALCLVAFFIVNGNPLRELRLMSNGVTVQGLATDVNDYEDRDDNGNLRVYFLMSYEFTTREGEKISDVVEVLGKSTHKGFHTGQILDIQYLTSAPDVHRIKALVSATSSGWLIKYLFMGLLTLAPGCYFLYKSYRSQRITR